MNVFCIEKYYTLGKIPGYRLQYIDSRISWLIESLGLKASDWPLDSIKLVDKIIDRGIIPMNYGFFDLSDNVDGVAGYDEEHGVHLMQINRSKIKHSLKNSLRGRPNFTVCHETGHSILGHNLIPKRLKTEEEIYIEELEADEFAGRILMPKWLLLSCNYYSKLKVAEYLLVSGAALWIRLNNLNSLITFKSKSVPTCTRCGNTRFSADAKYCGICGQSVSGGLNGIRRVSYRDDTASMRARSISVCPECTHYSPHKSSYSCILCSKWPDNYCMGRFGQGSDKCRRFWSSTHRFCEACGRPTYYYENKFIGPWQEVFDIMKAGSVLELY